MTYDNYLLAFGIGPWEWVVIIFLGLLIFGSRLPDVGKNLGRSIIDFKKGLQGVDDDVKDATRSINQEIQKPLPKDDTPQSK